MAEDVFVIPTSFAQQRLWFLDQLGPNTAAFNMSAAVRLTGTLNVSALERSLNEVVHRHESLRTTFAGVDGEPMQVIAGYINQPLPLIDLSGYGAAQRDDEVSRYTRAAAQTPFDLAMGPLLRTALLRLGETEHVLLLTMHHIISDGWSIVVFIREVTTLYSAFSRGEPSPLEELTLQYADYALWQRERLRGKVLEEALDYWMRQLAGDRPVLQLHTDRPRPAEHSYRGGSRSAELPSHVYAALEELSRLTSTTLFMVLLAGFKVLLHRYSGQTDISLGTPVAGRNRAEVEHLIGFFVNTLVLRTDLAGDPSFLELLRRVREVCLGAYEHQDLPFERLVEELRPVRDLSRTPVFQVFFNMLNFRDTKIELPGLTVELLAQPEIESKFDLTLYAREQAGSVRFELVYNADLFTDARMAEMLEQYVHVLAQASAQPERRLGEFSLLIPSVAGVLPDPTVELSDEWRGAVHTIFAAHARRVPDNLAAADGCESWSYGELEAHCNRLAHYLRAHGIERGDVVAIYGHRSAGLVCALLGVMKAGAAYVILDPAYPPSRLIAYLALAQPKAWLQLAAAGEPPQPLADYLAGAPLHCRLTLPRRSEAESQKLFAEFSPDDPNVPVGPDDVAYIAFTSGSTGVPKGIQGRHGPLTHFLPWLERTFGFHEGDRFSMLSGIAHDPLHRDIFVPLQLGASVIIPDPEEIPVPGTMAAWMARERITVANLTPGMGQLLTEPAARGALEPVASLRYVFFVGDVLTRRDVARLHQLAPSATCINYYGSTETQLALSYFVVPSEEDGREAPSNSEIVPLGRGIEDVQLLVLNKAGSLAVVGEAGEIFLRSPHLAQGYLGDDALTQERFIINPFTGRARDRLYRTGDLGRYLHDGKVQMLGRADQQVKIRGFRVELGEIEAELRKHQSVREAVVISQKLNDHDERLVGYLVMADEAAGHVAAGLQHWESELRQHLRERLPDYMMPSMFVALERLPLTPNGKIDRRNLPVPSAVPPGVAKDFVPPRNPIEEVLAGIWAGVLGVERVGVHDNFFTLGGHSLRATQVIARTRVAFEVDLPLRCLFEQPTVAEIAQAVTEALRKETRASAPALTPMPRQERMPLSFAQQRLWFLDQLEPGNAFYNVGAALRLMGPLDSIALGRSLQEVIDRHEVLRTTFVETNGQAAQCIARALDLWPEFQDLSALPEGERECEVQVVIAAELQRPFDLVRGPLLRFKLLRLASEEHVIVVTMHHIISDAWSSGVFVREMTALYEAFCAGVKSPLTPLSLQYVDYALWQRAWLRGETLERELAYWRERLGDAPAVLELPADRPRPPVLSHRGARHNFTLEAELLRALNTLGQREGATLYMTLLAAYQTLLHRYTGQTDISIGSPIAGRVQVATEDLIGFFANTLVLRTDLSGDPTFLELLRRVREVALGAYAHENVPFEMLVEHLQPPRSLSHTPLFQSALTLQNAPAPVVTANGLTLSPLEVKYNTAKFDLLLTVEDSAQDLRCFFEYSTDLFDGGTIERMAQHLVQLLAGIIANPDEKISRLPLLTSLEREQLLSGSARRARYPQGECLHELFERQSARRPDTVALTFGAGHLTYSELNARANALALQLGRTGVRSEDIVGVLLERAPELVTGLLAVLKAGGAYLPLNPADPHDRLRFMLDDAQCTVLLTQRSLAEKLPRSKCRIVFIDDDSEPASTENLAGTTTPENLAYVIYTSGSTGRPKGVQVTHANVTRLFAATAPWFSFDEQDVWTLFHSYTFDFSVWELWGALLYGGRLVIVPYWLSRAPDSFYELVCRERVTVLNQTPPAFRHFIAAGQAAPDEVRPNLRLVIFGGEALDFRGLKPWVARNGDTHPQLINMYGITETTVHVTYQPLTAKHVIDAGEESLIGGPIPDLEVYVLDRHLEPVPVGVRGEMYVGGDGLARGYMRRPDLTATRFGPHPFTPEAGARLYRTGDLARYRNDGTLEYLGRMDQQVKVRGFRIELGEIEAVLNTHQAVRESVVLAVEEDSETKILVAYVVAASEQPPTAGELQNFLRERVPEYMVPHAFVLLGALPLTTNGKVDRKSLLALDRTPVAKEFVAARTRTERTLAEVWAEVLGLEKIGVHDNFFELGGDSILSIQIVSKARQAGIRITPKQIFQQQTIAALAAVAEVAGDSVAPEDTQYGPVPLTPIQHWFFEQEYAQPHHYNQAVLLQTEQPLDCALLEVAVRQLVARHDALRLRYRRDLAGWRQVSLSPTEARAATAGPVVESVHVAGTEKEVAAAIERVAAETQMRLNLEAGPVLRVVVFDLGANMPTRLLVVIHHLVVDGVSWRILLEELQTGYAQLSRGQEVSLPAATISFRRWAEKLESYAKSGELEQERSYWLAAQRKRVKRLPFRETVVPPTYATARTARATLDAETTRALLQEAPAAYHTQINDMLLAALTATVRRRFGLDIFLIDLEGHGRAQLFEGLDTSRTVGWFTTQFPVLLDVSGANDPAATLRMIKEQLRAVPREGIGYGLLRYMGGDQVAAALRELPQADIRFNYLGQFDQSRDPEGCFTSAAEESGPTISPAARMSHKLDLSLRIINGQLETSWRYSEELFVPADVAELALLYLDELRALINHCRKSGAASYTTSDFPLARVGQQTLDTLTDAYGPLEDLYPLSPLQQGILFHTISAPRSDMYFLHLSCRFEGQLDTVAFKCAWKAVVNRQQSLRTAFAWEELAEPLQVVLQQAAPSWEEQDWRAHTSTEQTVRLEIYLRENRARGMELSKAPLMRLALFRLADNAYHFVWSSHHIVLDGWSYPIIIREVLQCYDAFRQGGQPQLPPPRPYCDYINWLGLQDLNAARDYWRQEMEGFNLPAAKGNAPAHDKPGNQDTHDIQKLRLSPASTRALRAFARAQQLTLNTLVQGAWALFLGAGDGCDVVFGSVVSGRPVDLDGAESMVGLLINTLPLRVRTVGGETLLPWLRRLQDQQIEMQQYAYSPLVEVQKWSGVPYGQSLFTSIISFLNYPVHDAVAEWDGPLRVLDVEFLERVNYPLALVASARDVLELELKYDRRRFDNNVARHTLGLLERVLIEFAAQPQTRVAEFSKIVSTAGQQQQRRVFKEARRRMLEKTKRKNLTHGQLEREQAS